MSELGTVLLAGAVGITFCAALGWFVGGIIKSWVER